MHQEIVGSSTGLRGVMEKIEQVAHTDVPVLILGETGTGKELVARAIHQRSSRSTGPFLRVNCGAIPGDLVDSELFGHERGAFTGAITTQTGWFERADTGTLFLDEIGELPLPAQVRVLRVLQDGHFKRVGGAQDQRTALRLIAATHRDLPAMIQRQQFREDLWYRISVFPIRLPPLRERRDDIPALAIHLAQQAGLRLHRRAFTPTAADLRLLQGYGWPGNVRELAAVIERAAILGEGQGLDIQGAMGQDSDLGDLLQSQQTTLDAVNRRAILEALQHTRGRIEGPKGAASLLGINPHTLRSRMRRLRIEWAPFRRR